MKKLYYIAALAAIGLASCTSEEEVVLKQAPQKIAFRTVTKKATRGALKGTVLPTDTRLYVTAYHNGLDNPKEPFHQYFHNMEFTADGSTGVYTSNNAPLYPEEGTLCFIGYTTANYKVNSDGKIGIDGTVTVKPTNVKVNSNTTDPEHPFINQLVLPYGENLVGQTDVMYSEVLHNVKCENQTEPNGLTLHHALAWLKVNFSSNVTKEDDNVILVRKVQVEDAAFSGTINVGITKDANDDFDYDVTATYTKTIDAMPFPAYDKPLMHISDAKDQEMDGLLVLPQTRAKISFEYCKRQEGPKDWTLAETDKTTGNITGYSPWKKVVIEDTNTDKWKAGKRYRYEVTIAKGNPITFSCEINDWDNGKSGSSNLDPTKVKNAE